MDTHDQQISRFAESGLGRITVNAGKSRSLGAEASLRAQVTENTFSLNRRPTDIHTLPLPIT